jgi:hypothetical protein
MLSLNANLLIQIFVYTYDLNVTLNSCSSADVIAWFGLSFERGIEWRDRFHGYVSIRTTFPFWTGKVLAGKLWQDLLLESKALFKPVR